MRIGFPQAAILLSLFQAALIQILSLEYLLAEADDEEHVMFRRWADGIFSFLSQRGWKKKIPKCHNSSEPLPGYLYAVSEHRISSC